MPPTWQLSLDSLHPIYIAVRNRLGIADRRLLSRALHVSPRTFPDVPVLLRLNKTHTSARLYTTRAQEHNDYAGAIEAPPSECAGTTSSGRPWRFVLSNRRIDLEEALFQAEPPPGHRISRLTQLDDHLAKIVARGPRVSPAAGTYSEKRRQLTDAQSDTQSPHESETVESTERRPRIIEQGAPISLQQPVEQSTSADEKRDMYSWFAEMPKEKPKGQSPRHRVQVDMTEEQLWGGISYFEAMQNLDMEQVSATTEGPGLPEVIAKTLSLPQSMEEAFQAESIIARQTEVPEHSVGQEAVQQRDQPLQLRLEKGQHTKTAENQGGLLAALFPEMSSAPDTGNRTVEHRDDGPENQEGLVAALFPEMTDPTDNEMKAAEDDPNKLLDMLFPELRAKKTEADHEVPLQQPPTETSLDSKEESGREFPEETCEQNEQLPQVTLQQKSARTTSGQKSTEKPKGRVEAKRTSNPGDGPGDYDKSLKHSGTITTRKKIGHDLSYHDVAPENLLEELFPEESKKQGKEEIAKREFVLPRMRLDMAAGPKMRHYIGSGEIKNPRQEQTCVVILQAVSPRLTEEDIRGLLQPSAHIEGWSSEYMKTIPMRDPTTLDRKDAYYILFRSERGALHFQKRLRNLHDMLFKQAPTSLLSPRIHPLSLTDSETGEDFSAALKLYTLGPPSQSGNVYTTVLRAPWPHQVARLVHNGGYPQVVDRAHGVDAKVLLHFDGMQPTKYEIVDAIRADGHDRGVSWDIVGGHNGGPTVVAGVVQLSTARRGDAYADTSALMRKLPPRWLVSFRAKAEAHRFVRRWHRRPFPWQPKEYAEYGEDMPTVRAEVLW